MATRDIRTSTPITICDVCGRTLLRGERSHAYLDGGARRAVCELCTSRAVAEGWVLEGTEMPLDGARGSSDRRRSLLGRLRSRREREPDGVNGGRTRPWRGRAGEPEEPLEDCEPDEWPDPEPMPAPPPVAPAPAPAAAPGPRAREVVREPRHVRAIPTSADQKFAAALEVFNHSEHVRTVAGVARSLGLPDVAVLPVAGGPGLIKLVVSWELCWYRYEIDLSEDPPTVGAAGQGYELDELDELERQSNATADDNGLLYLNAVD